MIRVSHVRCIIVGLLLLEIVSICFYYCVLDQSISHLDDSMVTPLRGRADGPSQKASSRDVEEEAAVVLFWNHYVVAGHHVPKNLNRDTLAKAGCPVTNCIFTEDVELFNRSNVVLFIAQYLYDVPNYRYWNQLFVFFEFESPEYPLSLTIFSNRTRYGFFNRTMTYRRDSDVVDLYKHGTIRASQSRDSYDRIIKNKSKLVAWFVSSCKTAGRREDYVRELSRFIPVDIYGKCGNLTCGESPGNQVECYEMLRSQYKFYLSFENARCPDYVTEKLFRALYYDTVPIVMGGADYSAFAPPNSFIHTNDFESPQKLSEYLLSLDRSDDLYARYFDWKSNYRVDLNPMDGWCRLCEMAHEKSPHHKVYSDINKWWVEERPCF